MSLCLYIIKINKIKEMFLIDENNYDYIRTPLFESSNLFHRGMGDSTDVVTKETYDFLDRADRELTLRPEGTAGVIRSYIENKGYSNGKLNKLWYLGTMYRYERPQKGRYRELTQFGCEAIGSNDPMLDAEIISIPVNLMEALGINKLKVKVNSLGNDLSRENYKKALVKYLKPHIDSLCDDCKERFKKNPLRILDCKVDKDNVVLKNAPRTLDYLDEESKKHFDEVISYLEALNISYEIDDRVIRGLDYYTHTVFEIEADIKEFGAQNVICGGGRYNNLVKSLDGPETSAVGFSIGIERLMMALEYENVDIKDDKSLDVFVIPVSSEEKQLAFEINQALRLVGISSDIDYLDKKINANFKQAENNGAKFAIIIGEEEKKNREVTIRNLKDRKEERVLFKDMIEYLYSKLDDSCSCDHENCECHKK